MSKDKSLTRRDFLRNSAIFGGAAGLLTVAPSTFAKTVSSKDRVLSFYNLHTGERVVAPYWQDGDYQYDAIIEISKVLRDHRTGEIMPLDKRLFDYLHKLQQVVGSHKRFEVISGYRSPRSNALLRDADSKGVAKKSYHMKGQAIDIRLPGTELKDLKTAAIKLRKGGVGYYPNSNFVHLDIGRPRAWRG